MWADLDQAEWFGFDTEFIGEKRDIPLICLIQIITEKAIYLLDPLHAEGWKHLGTYLADPGIRKLTHAGENDYRLMHQLLGVLPSNTFDLQVAVAFLGVRYPASLGHILQHVLGQSSSKGFTVADWTIRPLPAKMKKYAVEDVKYLPALFQQVSEKLNQLDRFGWVLEEMALWSDENYYRTDHLKKLLQQRSVASMRPREKTLLFRLAKWREARELADVEEEFDNLSNKQMLEIAKTMHSGKEALFRSRILPKAFIRQMIGDLVRWYESPLSSEEEAQLYQYTPRQAVDPVMEAQTQLVYQLLQMYCLQKELAVDMVLPPGELKRFRMFPAYDYPGFQSGWRTQFVPPAWRELMANRHKLEITMQEHSILLTHT